MPPNLLRLRTSALLRLNPETLCLLLEHSNALRQNVDAYTTNIDGFGHKFEPIINLESDEAPEQIANAIYIERLRQQEDDGETATDAKDLNPTKEEVEAKIAELRDLMRRERSKLVNFFEFLHKVCLVI